MIAKLRKEDGQALVLALAFLFFFGLVIATMLGFADASVLATERLRDKRSVLYAADGATDAAIQYARGNPAVGAFGAVPCMQPPQPGQPPIIFSMTLNGVTATVTCKSLAAPIDLDRTVEFTASVGGVPQVRANVRFYDSTGAPPPTEAVDVLSWTVLG